MTSVVQDVENYVSYTTAEKVAHICKPLFDHLEINFFQYVKQYYGGGRILLCSNKEWVKDYFDFEHYHHEYVNFGQNYAKHSVGFNIWSGCKQSHSSCRIWLHSKEKYNLDHLLAIHSNHDTYCEMFHFGGTEQNVHLPSVFLSNLDLFEHFTLYFHEKARDLIKQANANPFLPPKEAIYEDNNRWLLGVETQTKQDFLKRIYLNKFYLKGHLEDKYLTYRQMECIKGIVEGKSYREIADELHISNRTIDYHLAEVRQIFNVKTKRQLLEALYENDVLPFIKFVE